ncbi:MAG: chorismate mutase [Clostridia bacterium]|jgi:chorismate mutase
MTISAVRGAITVESNTRENILQATRELLIGMIKRNELEISDVISVIFTCTKDLTAVYPAVAARELGMKYTALFCCQEMDVDGSLPMCIRVLMHVSSNKDQMRMQHIYLREAKTLRMDLVHENGE